MKLEERNPYHNWNNNPVSGTCYTAKYCNSSTRRKDTHQDLTITISPKTKPFRFFLIGA